MDVNVIYSHCFSTLNCLCLVEPSHSSCSINLFECVVRMFNFFISLYLSLPFSPIYMRFFSSCLNSISLLLFGRLFCFFIFVCSAQSVFTHTVFGVFVFLSLVHSAEEIVKRTKTIIILDHKY